MKTFLLSLLACLLPLVVSADSGNLVKEVEGDSLVEGAGKGDVDKVMFAAAEGQTKVVKLLLKRGAKIDFQDELGRTPLFWASINYVEGTDADGPDTIQLLLASGANPNITDKKGQTSLAALRFYETPDLKAFLDAKANLNLLNR